MTFKTSIVQINIFVFFCPEYFGHKYKLCICSDIHHRKQKDKTDKLDKRNDNFMKRKQIKTEHKSKVNTLKIEL